MCETHTLNNYKKIEKSEILEEIIDIKNDKKIKNMFDLANKRYKKILKECAPYILSEDKSQEIDSVVEKAHRDITGY
ncbi:MAG: hypothetical protein M1479_02225 [Actinobacteria bacterium]|nr:hypothetical protein [Actinomycetota bacterium]